MKEPAVDRQGTIIAHHQTPGIPQPADGTLHDPAPLVAPQRPAVLRGRADAILLVRADQFAAPPPQTETQRIAVVAAIGDHPLRLLSWTPRMMPSAYADRGQRRFREPDLRRGGRVKVVSQRKTRAVDHHHPLRAFPPAGFAHSAAPFFSLGQNCRPGTIRSTATAAVRLTRSGTRARCSAKHPALPNPAAAASRSRDAGTRPANPAQRAPLRRIHRMPSSTLRSGARGRPPWRCRGRLGSRGRIFSRCASVSNRPYRGIGPPPGAASPFLPR